MNCTPVNRFKTKNCLFWSSIALLICIQILLVAKLQWLLSFSYWILVHLSSDLLFSSGRLFAECCVVFRTYLQFTKIIWNFDLILQIAVLQERLQFLLIWSCQHCECIYFLIPSVKFPRASWFETLFVYNCQTLVINLSVQFHFSAFALILCKWPVNLISLASSMLMVEDTEALLSFLIKCHRMDLAVRGREVA